MCVVLASLLTDTEESLLLWHEREAQGCTCLPRGKVTSQTAKLWPLCQWLTLLWQVKFTFAPPSVSTKRQGSKYSSEQVLLWDSGLGVEDVCGVCAAGGGVGNTSTEAIEKAETRFAAVLCWLVCPVTQSTKSQHSWKCADRRAHSLLYQENS